MSAYRCFLLNSHSAVADAAIILEAVSDDEALRLAVSAFREKGAQFSDYEVWQGARRVERQLNNPSKSGAGG